MSEMNLYTLLLFINFAARLQKPIKLKNIFILTGSNIEPRLSFLEKAEIDIGKKVGVIVKKSEVYESEPWGFEDDVPFLNQVLQVNSEFAVGKVLSIILEIEKEMGRVRKESSYTSRNIDIDILYFGDKIIEKELLQVPHPRMHLRRFTLVPLVEIAPKFLHPTFGLSNQVLLEKCEDHSLVHKFKVGNN